MEILYEIGHKMLGNQPRGITLIYAKSREEAEAVYRIIKSQNPMNNMGEPEYITPAPTFRASEVLGNLEETAS